jgi:hypothetical protein
MTKKNEPMITFETDDLDQGPGAKLMEGKL